MNYLNPFFSLVYNNNKVKLDNKQEKLNATVRRFKKKPHLFMENTEPENLPNNVKNLLKNLNALSPIINGPKILLTNTELNKIERETNTLINDIYSKFKTKYQRLYLKDKSPKSRNLIKLFITKQNLNKFYKKIQDFKARGKHKMEDFTIQDVLNKFGDWPRCYLTGRMIEYWDVSSYSFDHRMPVSQGGRSSLDNMEIALKDVNVIKLDYDLDDFIKICNLVAKHHPLSEDKLY